jgi:hypothetical protein
MIFVTNFRQAHMPDEQYRKICETIKQALQDCYAKHPEWFATGNMRAIEKSVLKASKPFLIDALQLSFGDGVLQGVYQTAQPESE